MKDFDTIHAKCRSGKTILKTTVIFVLSFITHCSISEWFSQYTDVEIWQSSLLQTRIIYWIIFSIMITFFIVKKKLNKYYVRCLEKKVSKNGKEMQYDSVEYTQTFLQKCFGIITVKFYNYDCTEKIVLKDVSKSILYYL